MKTILKSTLEIKNKLYSLQLTPKYLIWSKEIEIDLYPNGYSHLRKLYVQSEGIEVVYFQPGDTNKLRPPLLLLPKFLSRCANCLTCQQCSQSRSSDAVVIKISNILWINSCPNEHSFFIYFVKHFKRYKLRPHKVTFQSNDSSLIRKWIDALQLQIALQGNKRPKRLLIFVNPISGRRQAVNIFQSVEKYFKNASIQLTVIQTERTNHCKEYLQSYDLSQTDGVICVGGDGIYSEAVHGILSNTVNTESKERIFIPTPFSSINQTTCPIGIIPAGSTDTVSYTTQGINDPLTSTLNIILGKYIKMDVGAVFNEDKFLKYCISFLGYGYYGDCIKSSQQSKWLGPLRYDWAGFKKILGNKNYAGEILFLISENFDSHPNDGVLCHIDCKICEQKKKCIGENKGCENSSEGTWIKVSDYFTALNCFLISCRCRYALEGPAPFAHMGNGCADLMIVKKCSRIDFIKHLYCCTKSHLNQFDFPFIEAHRIKRFRFRSLQCSLERENELLQGKETSTSVWNCDGEVIDDPNIDYVIHSQILTVFGSGIASLNPSLSSINCFCD